MANQFEKGHEKSGGRQKGVENKVTQTARQLFVSTLEGQVPDIQEAFNKVKEKDPAKFLELFAKYAQYFVPRQMDIGIQGKIITVVPPTKK